MQTNDSWAAWHRAGRFAFRSLRRAGILNASSLLCTVVMVMGGCTLLAVAAAVQMEEVVASQAEVSLALKPAAADIDVQSMYTALQQVSGVAQVQFLPKEQALERERAAHPDLGEFLDRYQLQNPFPDIFLVRLEQVSAFGQLQTFLKGPEWSTLLSESAVTDLLEQTQSLERLQTVASALGTVAVFGIVLVTILLILLIADLAWARLQHRREERETVVLLGGSFVDSDGPVLLELLFTLWLSAIAAGVVIMLLLVAAPFALPDLVSDPLVSAFITGVKQLVKSSLPITMLFILCGMPFAVAIGLMLARFRAPILRHDLRA